MQANRWLVAKRQPMVKLKLDLKLLRLANEYIYTFYLLVDNEAGEYNVSFVKYRIAKFMINRLVH